ncbi:MAG: hypothetical protein ACREDR_14480, partial [Blastocatellia bacterium]
LNLLLLLTYGDISGVGPGVWNDWKSSLLIELYERTHARLSSEPSGSRPDPDYDTVSALRHEAEAAQIEDHADRSGTVRHIEMMPRRYARATSSAEVAHHVAMISRLEAEPVVVSWRILTAQHCTEVTIAARDEGGLFARIAGTLT